MEKTPRILVLEDDDNLRTVLEEVLMDEGYQVTAVHQGEAAVHHAQSEAFDLIIADIRMEGMDGLEALEKTQQLQPGIGSLIVSGYATEQETARAQRLDVGAYIHKPFKMEDLLRHIRNELSHRKNEEKTLEKADFHRQTLDWTLTTLAEAIDDSGVAEGSLRKAGQRAESLCRNLGLETEVSLSARWATIVQGSLKLAAVSIPAHLREPNTHLPILSEILRALEGADETKNSLPSSESQAVHLCLESEVGDGKTSRNCHLYGEAVVTAFENLPDQEEPGTDPHLAARLGLKSSETQKRSLVSLASALERLGDDDNARRAYSSLIEDTVAERERLEGFLGMARLAKKAKQPDEARNYCLNALNLARSRGPSALAQLGLESALLLQQLKAQEAEGALREVGHAAKSTTFDGGLALVRCALSELQGRELEQSHAKALLAPAGMARLGRYVNWLYLYLFRSLATGDNPVHGDILCQLVCDYNLRFLHWFDTTRCPNEQRVAVARALAKTKYLPEIIIEKLQQAPEREIKEVGSQLKAQLENKSVGQLLRVHSFGQPAIFSQGEPLPESKWKTRKIKYLFYLLASQWGKPVTEDYILDAFWPKDGQKNKKNLYWGTTNLRALLKKLTPQTAVPLQREHDALCLNDQVPRWHDLEEFRKASSRGLSLLKSGDSESALGPLRLAAQIYTGPYLDGCFHEFALGLKTETEDTALEINLKATEILLNKNDDDSALEHATTAVEIAPYRQDARALCMRSQIRLGQTAQAIDQFHAIEKILKEDYELEPTTELLELFHRARLGFTDA